MIKEGTLNKNCNQVDNTSEKPHLYFMNEKLRKQGVLSKFVGGVLFVFLGIVVFPIIALIITVSTESATSFFVPGISIIVGSFLIGNGVEKLKLSRKFEKIIYALKGKTFADIKDLALACTSQKDTMLKDIKKMLSKGWFLQGHLDLSENCLMVSEIAYKQYLATMNNVKQQKEEKLCKEEPVKKQEPKSKLTPEAQSVINDGREYIKKIRQSNDNIPGIEVSEKISRMEKLVEKIFQQVELHPENIPNLRRLMDYYLPMTIKLLNSYQELDSHPVAGKNIAASKAEIVDMLDTMNIAFEKLFDKLFQDASLDISTDISVLQSMLAQDGLIKDDFPKM